MSFACACAVFGCSGLAACARPSTGLALPVTLQLSAQCPGTRQAVLVSCLLQGCALKVWLPGLCRPRLNMVRWDCNGHRSSNVAVHSRCRSVGRTRVVWRCVSHGARQAEATGAPTKQALAERQYQWSIPANGDCIHHCTFNFGSLFGVHGWEK